MCLREGTAIVNVEITTDSLFTEIGRLYMEVRARTLNEQHLMAAIAAKNNLIAGLELRVTNLEHPDVQVTGDVAEKSEGS